MSARLAFVALVATGCGRINFDPLDAPDPAAAATAKSVALGDVHACAIDINDHLWCWGANGVGEIGIGTRSPHEPPTQVGTDTWAHVAVGSLTGGGATSCGIKTDGTLWCWGYNVHGQLGIGSTQDEYAPVQVGARLWLSVSVGVEENVCAIQSDQTLWCWGGDITAGGVVGDGGLDPVLSPVQITTDTWLEVDVEDDTACAIRSDRTRWCWGGNGSYHLGDGTNTSHDLPTQTDSATDWAHVVLARPASCGIKTNGSLWCWGNDVFGATEMLPVPIMPQAQWTGFSARGATCAIDLGDYLWCWGLAERGLVGLDVTGTLATPTPIAPKTGESWTGISAGANATCGIRGGELVCTGADVFGQLGRATSSFQPVPTRIDGGWAAIGGGQQFGCGAKADGTFACWGRSGHGVLGTDGLDQQPVSQQGTGWSGPVVAADQIACAQRAGRPECWGDNEGGLAMAPIGVVSTPIAYPGYSVVAPSILHGCGIQSDSSLWCWGRNGSQATGVLGGDGSPVAVGSTWKSVATGVNYTCGVRTDGTLWCWGDNYYFQAGQPAMMFYDTPAQVGVDSDWSDVHSSAFSYTTCARKTSGALFCWGENLSGQIGTTGPATPTPTQVGTATDWANSVALGPFGCGIRSGTIWCWGGLPQQPSNAPPVAMTSGSGATFVEVTALGFNTICGLASNGDRWCWGDNAVGQLGDGRAWAASFTPVLLR